MMMRMRENLATLVEEFRLYAAETAVVTHRGVRRYVTTYGELATLAGRFAAELERRGVGRASGWRCGARIRRVDWGVLRMPAARSAGGAAGCGRVAGVCGAGD